MHCEQHAAVRLLRSVGEQPITPLEVSLECSCFRSRSRQSFLHREGAGWRETPTDPKVEAFLCSLPIIADLSFSISEEGEGVIEGNWREKIRRVNIAGKEW